MQASEVYLSSFLGGIDAMHFQGTLAAEISAVEKAQFVTVQFEGASNSKSLFVRSRFPSWAAHPAISQLAGLEDEKSVKLIEGLVATPAMRFSPLGSDLVFSQRRFPLFGRQVPLASSRAGGLADLASIPGHDMALKSVSLNDGVLGELYRREKEKTVEGVLVRLQSLMTYVDPSAVITTQEWEAMSPEEQTAALQTRRRATELEERSIAIEARTSALGALPASNTAGFDLFYRVGGELRRPVSGSNLSAMAPIVNAGLLTWEEATMLVVTNHVSHTAPGSLGAPTGVLPSRLIDLVGHIEKLKEEVTKKGFALTGRSWIARAGGVASTPRREDLIPKAYQFDNGETRVCGVEAPPEWWPRHGSASLLCQVSGMYIVFEVLREHDFDIINVGTAVATNGTFIGGQYGVVCTNSVFTGGVAVSLYSGLVEPNIKWYLSSVDEDWHPGFIDPLAEADLSAVQAVQTAATGYGNSVFALTEASVNSFAALGGAWYYLPLLAPLGEHNLMYRISSCEFDGFMKLASYHTPVDQEEPVDLEVIEDPEAAPPPPILFGDAEDLTVEADVAVVHGVLHCVVEQYGGSVSADWLLTTASTGFGIFKPMSAEEQAKVREFTTDLGGRRLAFAAYSEPVRFPGQIVERTDIYREYKKAKEKACQTNDFMKQKYAKNITWGQAQTAVAKQGSSSAIYGLYESVSTSVAAPVYTSVTYTYVPGTAPAVLTRKLGTDVVNMGVEFADDIMGEIALGARLVGITLATLATSWGEQVATPVTLAAEQAEMAETYAATHVNASRAKALTGGAGLNWASSTFSVYGYPFVEKLLYQDALKAIIGSVNLYTSAGAVARTAIERTGGATIERSALAGQRILANLPDPLQYFGTVDSKRAA